MGNAFGGFEEKIGINFKNKDLLMQALTHRSYLNENKACPVGHNERLEFLGDAVLELVVTEHLFEKYPDKTEGEMTAIRSALVNTEMLFEVAKDLSINDFMLLSKGETNGSKRAKVSLLARAVEAIIGAAYIDQGYGSAKSFIEKFFLSRLEAVVEQKLWIDSKSLFQEKVQETESITPHYMVMKEYGPDHEKHFTVGVYVGKELIATGEGCSKKDAEQQAARNALSKKGLKGWI